MYDIFINKKKWKQFDEKEMNCFVEQIFAHYRKNGFPFFSSEHSYREKELSKFLKANTANIWDGDSIGQNMAGLSFCWSYMPHSYKVVCNNMRTPYEVFSDDRLFLEVIRKRIKMGDNISDSGIRKMLKIFTGTQCVSNFRPTAATAIYERYAREKDVWDMSCGYGGRLLGAMKAGVNRYIGTEPCSDTFNGLCSMIKEFPEFFNPERISLNKIGSENFIPDTPVDFCFTSPPYFNTEKYSTEETQSYMSFPTREEWMNGFMRSTFDNCYSALKKDGKMAINIANVKSYPNIEEDMVKVAEKAGFSLECTLKYSLSSLSHKEKYKYEPIFVFNK